MRLFLALAVLACASVSGVCASSKVDRMARVFSAAVPPQAMMKSVLSMDNGYQTLFLVGVRPEALTIAYFVGRGPKVREESVAVPMERLRSEGFDIIWPPSVVGVAIYPWLVDSVDGQLVELEVFEEAMKAAESARRMANLRAAVASISAAVRTKLLQR